MPFSWWDMAAGEYAGLVVTVMRLAVTSMPPANVVSVSG